MRYSESEMDSFYMDWKLQLNLHLNKDNSASADTHTAKAQMFLWPQNGRRTVAKARPWVNISVTWEGR